MKGHILVNLSGKDSKLKTWFDQQKDSNISRIVLSAVIYYELTGEYMNIGRLSTVDANLPDSHKIIYIPKQGKAREILEEWEKIDKRVSTKIKRILNMGVLIEPDLNTNYLINEDEAIETVEKILRSVNKGAYIKPAISGNIEPLFIKKQSSVDEKSSRESRIQVAEVAESNNKPKDKNEPKQKDFQSERKPQNLIASFLESGCGLGN